MDKPNRRSGGVLSSLLAFPFKLIAGYLVGLLTPVAALAAIVGGIYLVTHKVPFLNHTSPDDEGGQQLSFKLMPPDQAHAAFVRQKERISAELNAMSAEIKALAEQAKED
ncbi:MAG: hypothetical protein JXM73_09505 [Anaerolineae bacterium]|nr:hypothetical protein [Anaerolineae bacterium]